MLPFKPSLYHIPTNLFRFGCQFVASQPKFYSQAILAWRPKFVAEHVKTKFVPLNRLLGSQVFAKRDTLFRLHSYAQGCVGWLKVFKLLCTNCLWYVLPLDTHPNLLLCLLVRGPSRIATCETIREGPRTNLRRVT